jgi:hypothetical protein
MVDQLHIHIKKRIMKQLAIALRGAGLGITRGGGDSDVNNVQFQVVLNWNNKLPVSN